jgi:hypothetical protein
LQQFAIEVYQNELQRGGAKQNTEKPHFCLLDVISSKIKISISNSKKVLIINECLAVNSHM